MSDKSEQQNPLSKNFLGKNFYVVVTTPTAPREKLEPLKSRASRQSGSS